MQLKVNRNKGHETHTHQNYLPWHRTNCSYLKLWFHIDNSWTAEARVIRCDLPFYTQPTTPIRPWFLWQPGSGWRQRWSVRCDVHGPHTEPWPLASSTAPQTPPVRLLSVSGPVESKDIHDKIDTKDFFFLWQINSIFLCYPLVVEVLHVADQNSRTSKQSAKKKDTPSCVRTLPSV